MLVFNINSDLETHSRSADLSISGIDRSADSALLVCGEEKLIHIWSRHDWKNVLWFIKT